MESKKVELKHFQIGRFYGGSQTWMMDPWMRLGGCGALAAVDSCIYFALYKKVRRLVPDAGKMNKSKYTRLAMEMKPYLGPRHSGINKMSIYVDGFEKYLNDKKIDAVKMETFAMGTPKSEAWNVFKTQIDEGMIVPVLLLIPASREWKEYHWHWFLLNGYEESEKSRLVKAVTYGEYEWLSWDGFWDEEHAVNGGMILYRIEEAPCVPDALQE